MRFTTSLLVAIALIASQPVQAQNIKPRVILMVDTSGSMASHMTDDCSTGGDGSSGFVDNGVNISSYYSGYRAVAVQSGMTCNISACTTFDGIHSRLFNAKQAINNVINASGDIDWGLERYQGTTCAVNAAPFTAHACDRNNQCTTACSCTTMNCGGHCTCTSDFDCPAAEVCNAGTCGTDANLCTTMSAYGEINPACSAIRNSLPGTYNGSCGTNNAAGATCSTTQTCFADTDCTGGGTCTALAGTGAKACTCTGASQCPGTAWTCTSNRCVYNATCRQDGGFVLVDPSVAGSSGLIGEFVDNLEDYTPRAGSPTVPKNRELRADGLTPLAGAARSATAWYQSVIASDTKSQCRPYILVQLTDGFDTCDTDTTNGPVAAAHGFVGATVAGAKTPNKVYVIGLAFGGVPTTSLDAVAKAGGTNKARLANTQQDIQAALADIVASSVLVEKCNHVDDNCDGKCDEAFPDVAVTNPAPDNSSCSNPHAATTCDNGARPGSHCFATGNFVCSADTLSEVCSAPKCPFVCPGDPMCATNPLCAVAETCNGIDDDCNGTIDDCTANSPNTCSCATNCPPCATGGPFPETCNGCDDDCDGIADNHLNDTGIACGSNIGICLPGTTFCCQQVNPTTGTCTTDPITTRPSPAHTNPDTLFCLGGTNAQMPQCNGCDNDCDGQTDKPSQACYSKGDGGCTFAAGTWTCKGICQTGAQICSSSVCTSAPMFGACVGDNGKSTEVCNGLDDDCDGTTDVGATDVGGDCCPTGNLADCDNTNGGTHCKRGKIACVAGGKVCQNGVAKAPETCNNIDDDCNNMTDDVPGIGAACTGAGIKTLGPCKASYVCMGTMPGTGPNGLTCKQTTGPTMEICNGVDDDCDGTPDNNLMDPRVGVPGGTPCTPLTPLPGTTFPNGQPQPPCDPGITACVAGNVVCQGEVTPSPNQCNGLSTDCTGTTSNGMCPSGFQCVQGNCVMPCSGGEFPCPGGFVCDTATNLCIPDKCAMISCQAGFLCNIDSMGNAHCVDPCTKVNCGTDYQCVLGSCVDCHQFGCPSGQLCIGTPGKCQPDPCNGVMCPQGQFCDTNGQCTMMCTGNCPPHEICLGGSCQPDPCFGMKCNTDEVCTVQGNPPAGVCVPNMCAGGCTASLTCCGGTCRMNQCDLLQCPEGSMCELDSACNPTCAVPPAGPSDQVVGAGGGGTACSTVPGEAPRGSGLGLALLVVAALLLSRRRREAR